MKKGLYRGEDTKNEQGSTKICIIHALSRLTYVVDTTQGGEGCNDPLNYKMQSLSSHTAMSFYHAIHITPS